MSDTVLGTWVTILNKAQPLATRNMYPKKKQKNTQAITMWMLKATLG